MPAKKKCVDTLLNIATCTYIIMYYISRHARVIPEILFNDRYYNNREREWLLL